MALLKENNTFAEEEFVKPIISQKEYTPRVDGMADHYQKLKTVHQLQKSLVEQSTHKAMSPISAISGYLELINLSLFDDEADVNKIATYQEKIKRGIEEISVILEQLRDIYQDEVSEEVESPLLNVDLNWIIRERCDKVQVSSSKKIIFDDSNKPTYVRTNLLMSKLVIRNLLNYVLKNSFSDGNIHLFTTQNDEKTIMGMEFKMPERKRDQLHAMLNGKRINSDDQNLYAVGVEKSIAMVQQINGNITFEKGEENTLILQLVLPTAGGVV